MNLKDVSVIVKKNEQINEQDIVLDLQYSDSSSSYKQT